MTRTESLFRNPELKMEFKGPYRLDSIQQYKNELDQFGLYFRFFAEAWGKVS